MCPDGDDWRLTAYALGELDGSDAAEIERLMARDPAARQAVEEIRRTAGVLSGAMQDTGIQGLTQPQREAVLSVCDSGGRRRLRVWLPLAAAAVAALAVAVGWWIIAGRPDRTEGRQNVAEKTKKTKAPGLEPTPGNGDPTHMGTPGNDPDVTPAPDAMKAWPPESLPAGAANAALHKAVTTGAAAPLSGKLAMVTDGDLTGGAEIILPPGRQWVQIDLGADHEIFAIRVWHHPGKRVYRDVIVQVCDAAAFETNVHTLFNNDRDNSAGLGLGRDREYIENHRGLVIDAGGMTGRYVRLYSSGNTADEQNHYTEVEVYAKPLEKGK